MSSVEWNKKEDLVAEQALKHLKVDRNVKFGSHMTISFCLFVGICSSVCCLLKSESVRTNSDCSYTG